MNSNLQPSSAVLLLVAMPALAAALLLSGCVDVPPGGNGTNVTPGNNTANVTPSVPPGYEVKEYCEKDSDCVRLNSCCDCGLGVYVNKYNQQPECPADEPRCLCPIALSEGRCQENRCVAVAQNVTPEPEPGLNFTAGKGVCGSGIAPERTDTEGGIFLNGSIQGADPCMRAEGELIKDGGGYALNITTSGIPGVETGMPNLTACVGCVGAVPWNATISGYTGTVSVYYDGEKVFPSASGFCGWSTNGTCSDDGDCDAGGCSGQVCESNSEEPIITTCEYRDCYNAQAYGVTCGCDDGKCRWQ